jgi:TRAP-type mannitol/chloroaromatic compound transport system permease small subunit
VSANSDPQTNKGGASWLGRPVSLFTGFCHLMNSAGTLWVFGLMFLICADIFARNFFQAPIRGVAEIVGYSIVGTVYLQLANTLHSGRFTRAELLIDWLEARRPFAGLTFKTLFNLAGVIVFAMITHGVWPSFVDAWTENEVAGVPGDFTFIIWPFKLLVILGSAATCIEFFIQFCQSAAGATRSYNAVGDAGEPLKRGWGWLIVLGALMLVVYLATTAELTNGQIGALSILSMLVLIYAGMPIGIALIVLGFVGIWFMKGNTIIAERMLALAAVEYMRNYFFGVVPLFVLMGLLVAASDVGKETFQVARWALRNVRARHRHRGRHCGICGDYRLFDRVGGRVHPRSNAGNDVAGLHAAVLRGRCRGFVRSWHAHSAQPASDRIRFPGGTVGRHFVYRGSGAGDHSGGCFCAADSGHGDLETRDDRRCERVLGGRR